MSNLFSVNSQGGSLGSVSRGGKSGVQERVVIEVHRALRRALCSDTIEVSRLLRRMSCIADDTFVLLFFFLRGWGLGVWGCRVA